MTSPGSNPGHGIGRKEKTLDTLTQFKGEIDSAIHWLKEMKSTIDLAGPVTQKEIKKRNLIDPMRRILDSIERLSEKVDDCQPRCSCCDDGIKNAPCTCD